MGEAATVATADTAVVEADSEIAATRAEAMEATENAVANVTEVVIEATVAVEVTRLGLKFPMFPKVKLQLCCPTISVSRCARIKDSSTFTRLNSEFSMMRRIVDFRLYKVSEPNSRLCLEFILPILRRSSHQLKSTKSCNSMQMLAEESEK